MFSTGRGHHLDFTDEEIARLRECFDTLDEDGGGAIGLEELETPLIGLGFANSREEVKTMMDTVDVDGSGQLEFDEFLLIIKAGTDKNEGLSGAGGMAKIHTFFKDLSSGNIGNKDLSFNIIVQDLRRENMLEDLLKKKRANVRLEWCKANNFDEDRFKEDEAFDFDPNDLLF